MSQTPTPKTYFARSTWAVSTGGALLAFSVFVAQVAPFVHDLLPWFGPNHQRLALATGVLLASIGSILSHKGGTESTQDLRQEVREAGVRVAAEAPKDGTGGSPAPQDVLLEVPPGRRLS